MHIITEKKVKSLEKTGIKIPDTFKVEESNTGSKNIEVKRSDGFTVFLNELDDPSINYIRLHADKKDVMMAVGLYRGMQIAQNYKKKYARFEDVDYMGFMGNILKTVGRIKFITCNKKDGE